MLNARSAWAAVAAAIMWLACAPSPASTLETLMMPGKLIQGHAKFESQCQKCHQRFRKVSQSELCLDCHKKVAADVSRREGFHGRIPGIRGGTCTRCHTEHKGRGADIVMLDKETFNHQDTDFALKGAHTAAPCGACHQAGRKYREAPHACNDCHKADDPHHGRLGGDCARCHSERTWRRVGFDHAKTDFPLKGKHRDVNCKSCHPNERYKQVPKACVACHKLDDAHGGRYGDKCHTCHTAADWKRVTFDHDRDTKYRLAGRHARVACDRCHTGRLYEDKLGTGCIDCHRNDDYHKGRYGRKCNDCHDTGGWGKARFDHDRRTRFPLRGAHAKTACRDCHRGDLYRDKLKSDCLSCHAADDVHRGQEGRLCQRCHTVEAWGKRVVFDHDLTRFPLIGLHATVPCEECHLSSAFKGTARDCRSCHAGDDQHKGRLGPGCARCHNPNGWSRWIFDHDTQTDYKLDGKHRNLDCHACHKTPASGRIRLSSACATCHQRDDVHAGRFGQACERCHVTESFKKVALRR